MRFHVIQTYAPDGTSTKTLVDWDEADYVGKIAEIEATITPRRMREAILTAAGAEWLAAREAEITALRAELALVKAAQHPQAPS